MIRSSALSSALSSLDSKLDAALARSSSTLVDTLPHSSAANAEDERTRMNTAAVIGFQTHSKVEVVVEAISSRVVII